MSLVTRWHECNGLWRWHLPSMIPVRRPSEPSLAWLAQLKATPPLAKVGHDRWTLKEDSINSSATTVARNTRLSLWLCGGRRKSGLYWWGDNRPSVPCVDGWETFDESLVPVRLRVQATATPWSSKASFLRLFFGDNGSWWTIKRYIDVFPASLFFLLQEINYITRPYLTLAPIPWSRLCKKNTK